MREKDGKTTYYVYGVGLISEETENQAKFYHFDVRGSTVVMTDEDGRITDTFAYDTYGNSIGRTGETDTEFMYCGQYGVQTDDNGLIYMRARYYAPEIQHFLSLDPVLGSVSDPQSLNRYAFCGGNPVTYVDPNGKSAAAIFAGSWSIGGGLAVADGFLPYGDAAGLVVGVVGTLIAGGVLIYEISDSLLNIAKNKLINNTDKNNTKKKDGRLYGNPGDINVEGDRQTKIGKDGRATKERHNTDHGKPKFHTNPHDHDISWDNGHPKFGPAQNYRDGNVPDFNEFCVKSTEK